MRLAAFGWSRVRFTGPEAAKFLHGQLTADVLSMKPGERRLACLLTTKGRLRGVYELRDLTLLGDPLSIAHLKEDLGKRIMLADAKMEDLPGPVWRDENGWGWGGEPGGPGLEEWLTRQGLPLYGRDLDEETLPQEAGLDAALSFTKGCYLGQETMSRLHHLGHVNRRLVRIVGEPPAEARVTSRAGDVSLAWVKAGSPHGVPVVVA